MAHRNAFKRRPDVAREFVRKHANAFDTKYWRRLRSLLLSGDDLGIAALDVNPANYSSAELFKRDWLAVNILAKYPELRLGLSPKAEALSKFLASETHCKSVNSRLNGIQRLKVLPSVSAESLIFEIRRKIVRLIGWEPKLDAIGNLASFSGGASTRLKRRQGDPYYKLQGRLHVTSSALHLALCFVTSCPIWARSLRRQYGCNPFDWVEVVKGSRSTTVAKNAKTDRFICIEPELNMLLQKGVGGFFRRALLRRGVDLNDQTLNQGGALIGSVDDSYATLDMKAASDSVSLELVKLLLPSAWYDLLVMLRSPLVQLPNGDWHHLEKISAMGNGYTFELESLIFWAISEAVTDHIAIQPSRPLPNGKTVCIYGDDIIVPKAASGFLVEVLHFFGFETNWEKSFCSGPFRESCGKHYFRGVDVTPFYIRKPINGIHRLYWFANQLRLWASRETGSVCDPRYKDAYSWIVDLIPGSRRYSVPMEYADGGLIAPFDEAMPSYCKRRQRFKVRYLSEIAMKMVVEDDYAYARELLADPGPKRNGVLPSVMLVAQEKRYASRVSWISGWGDVPYWPSL